jgi:outer membrane immunogenic protein
MQPFGHSRAQIGRLRPFCDFEGDHFEIFLDHKIILILRLGGNAMRHSKFFVSLAVAAGVILSVGSASAADLPAKVYTKAPPPVPMYNWTGCYIGAVAGGEWGTSRSVSNGTNNGVANGTAGALKNETDLSGGNAGGTLGCNYQSGVWVVGIEGDGSWSNRNGSSNLLAPNFVPTFTESINSNWLATVRGRAGWTVGPTGNLLLYGTAGGAFADLRINEFSPAGLGAIERHSFSGWTAGFGAEWGFAPGWSVKSEYLYADLGRKGYFQNTATGCCTFQNTRLTDSLFRLGVNYHWNWASPVVAKY